MKNSEDQKQVDAFIDNLVKAVTKKYGEKIDFIILVGSASKGQFVKGASDIDLLIQVINQDDVGEVKDYAAKLFWKLDKKHGLGFRNYLANAKANTLGQSFFRKIENTAFLYTPIFVMGPDDLDWEKGRVKRSEWVVPARLVVSIGTLFLKFKKEGKLLYGRDIRKLIRSDIGFWEKWKAICIPVYFTLLSLILVLFVPRQAVKYSIKAILWGVESALVYVNELIRKTSDQVKRLKELSTLYFQVVNINQILQLHFNLKYHFITREEFKVVNKAIKYKREGFDGGLSEAFKFVWESFIFILKINFIAILRYR